MNRTCNHCHRPIPAGEAVIRSISFEQVSWHRDCYEVHMIAAATARRAA